MDLKIPKAFAHSVCNKISNLKMSQSVRLPSEPVTSGAPVTPMSPAIMDKSYDMAAVESVQEKKEEVQQANITPNDEEEIHLEIEDDCDDDFKPLKSKSQPFSSKIGRPIDLGEEEPKTREEEVRELLMDLDGNAYMPSTTSKVESVAARPKKVLGDVPVWNVNDFSPEQREST